MSIKSMNQVGNMKLIMIPWYCLHLTPTSNSSYHSTSIEKNIQKHPTEPTSAPRAHPSSAPSATPSKGAFRGCRLFDRAARAPMGKHHATVMPVPPPPNFEIFSTFKKLYLFDDNELWRVVPTRSGMPACCAWTTGCPTISVTSDTPLFSDICRRSRLSFHELNGHSAGFDFLKNNFKIFFRVRVRARYKPSLVFRLGLVLSKFTFSAGIQLLGLKTTSHGKPDLKNSFSRSDLRHGEDQGEVRVQEHPVFQHLPVLRGYSIFRPENHFTW